MTSISRVGTPLETRTKRQAVTLGFDEAAITGVDLEDLDTRLAEFLGAGFHGTMDWLAADTGRRSHPKRLWPDARSIVVVGQNYGPDGDPLTGLALKDRGLVSVYSSGDDYHDIMKKRLKALARWFVSETGAEVKVFVDTAPVMEKPIAAEAGLGWQGKHTNLVSRRFGSWLFLGAMFTTARLRPDTPETDHCGRCRACLDICPTDAFPAPYRLDARRCISYLTIEHKGPIARDLRPAIGNRIYGCDDCLAVCPWNKFARSAEDIRLKMRPQNDRPPLDALAALDDAAFRTWFRKSPVKRTGRDRFVRNVLIAIGNSGEPALAPAARARLDDDAPLVRGMAIWALSRLMAKDSFEALHADRAGAERDPEVREEWRLGLAEREALRE